MSIRGGTRPTTRRRQIGRVLLVTLAVIAPSSVMGPSAFASDTRRFEPVIGPLQSSSAAELRADAGAGNTIIGWGTDYTGAVGTGDTSPEAGNTAVVWPTPVAATPALAGRTVTKVVANWNTGTCALASGDLVCWGSRRTPTLDDTTAELRPGSITDFDRTDEVTCVVSDGKAYCRGANYRGQLGNGSHDASSVFVPVRVDGALAGLTVQAISVGGHSACALADGRAFCWGYNYFGQLGVGTSGDGTDSSVPLPVDTTGALKNRTIDEIGAGSRGACARSQQHVYCWGEETMLGVARQGPMMRTVPGEIDTTGALAGRTITDLDLIGETACVLADGAPYCWGSGAPYWGIGTTNVNSYLPVAIRTPALTGKTATDLVVGGISCVLASGEPICWGDNSSGGLGVGNWERDFLPAATYTGGALAGRTITKLGGGGVQAAFAITAEPPGQATASGTFTAIQPVRAVDTRNRNGRSAAVAGGGQTDVRVSGIGGIPAGAAAVSINLTVTEPAAPGYLTAAAAGTPAPPTSNLNFAGGQTVANMAIVPVGRDGSITVRNGSSAPAQVIVDVTGYYLGGTPVAAGAFASVAPGRLLDTRIGTGGARRPLGAGQAAVVQVSGRSGVPLKGASAAVINLTATNTGSGGYLTAYASGTPRPSTSNLNFMPGATSAALAVVPIGADGTITLVNGSTSSTVDLIADVAGFYLTGTPTAAGSFIPVPPTRLLDTRRGLLHTGPVPPQGSAPFTVGGDGPLPRWATASAAVTVTIVDPPSAGYASIRPQPQTGPAATSTINFVAGQTVANAAVTSSRSQLFNGSAGAMNAIVDVFGYFHS